MGRGMIGRGICPNKSHRGAMRESGDRTRVNTWRMTRLAADVWVPCTTRYGCYTGCTRAPLQQYIVENMPRSMRVYFWLHPVYNAVCRDTPPRRFAAKKYA